MKREAIYVAICEYNICWQVLRSSSSSGGSGGRRGSDEWLTVALGPGDDGLQVPAEHLALQVQYALRPGY